MKLQTENITRLQYAVMYKNGFKDWLVAAFVHESDAKMVCNLWNDGRDTYYIKEIDND